MLKLIVVNGCSLTYGRRLQDPERSCWGRLVADGLGADFVNLAAGGGSNRRIVRTTVEHLGRITSARGLSPAEVLFVGMWTEISRAEVYDGRPDEGFRPADYDDPHWNRIGPWQLKNKHEKSIRYYKHFQDDRGDIFNFLLDSILLQQFLRQGEYNYAFALAWDFLPADAFRRHPQLSAQIDAARLLGGFDACGQVSFYDVVKRRFPIGQGLHPLEEAHHFYANEYLLPWLRKTIPAADPSEAEARRAEPPRAVLQTGPKNL